MKYSTTLMAAANIVALSQAAPAAGGPGCSMVVVTYTGAPVWVPTPDPGWMSWTTTSSKSNKASSTSSGAWPAWTTTTTKADPWASWTTSKPAKPTTTTTWTSVLPPLSFGNSTTTTTTYSPYIYTPTTDSTTTTPTTTTTTTTPPAATATCPSSNGATILGGASCDCEFQVNCASHADASSANFWQQNEGTQVGSLAECIAICDDNADCEAVIWDNASDASSADYMICWQTSGLGGIIGSGEGQISYKGSCSGQCAQSYNS